MPDDCSRPGTYIAAIVVPGDLAERVAARLEAAEAPSAGAVTLFARGESLVEVAAYYDTEPDRASLLALLETIASAGIDERALTVAPLPHRDWVREAEALRKPVRAGRFLVHGRHDRDRIARGRYTLEIDAGLAFGTGQHASTKGCLIALDRILKACHPKTVFDIGTGTGILAIAAAKAAGAKVLASDLDPPVAAAARENVRQSGVSGLVRVLEAEGLDHAELRGKIADLLFANLLLGPLLALAPDFSRAVRPGGLCVLSGLLKTQARQAEARYRSFGFRLHGRLLIDEWATLVLIRAPTRPSGD